MNNHTTHTILTNDATTCVGCVAFRVGGAMCAGLRADGTCQKVLASRAQMATTIARLITLAVIHHQEQAIGPVIRAMLDGQPAGIIG